MNTKAKKEKVGFNFTQDVIDKLNECVRLKNLEYEKIANTYTTKQDYVAELIEKDYNRLISKTRDAETNDRINQRIDFEIESRFAALHEVTNETYEQVLITQRLLDFLIQKTVNEFEDVVRERNILEGTDEYYQIKRDYEEHLKTIIERDSDGLNAVQELFYKIKHSK